MEKIDFFTVVTAKIEKILDSTKGYEKVELSTNEQEFGDIYSKLGEDEHLYAPGDILISRKLYFNLEKDEIITLKRINRTIKRVNGKIIELQPTDGHSHFRDIGCLLETDELSRIGTEE